MVMVMNLYSAFSTLICSNAHYKQVMYGQGPDHNTGNSDECVGSSMSRASHYSEDAGDGAYGLSSLYEKTRISKHLQMSLQRQHILISYIFKTPSVGPVWDSNPRPPSW